MNKVDYIKKCSKCNSPDYVTIFKETTRGQETIIKCLKCNHEKVEYITNATGGIYTLINDPIMNYKHNGIEYF